VQSDKDILAPLTEKLSDLADRPVEDKKKKMWADHQALRPTDKIPVSVYYEGIPPTQWKHMFGPDFLKCTDPLARSIEYDLRRRIWMAENVPDDHIVWKTIIVSVPMTLKQDWGVEICWTESDDDLGAHAYNPPFKEKIDISMLTKPVFEWDTDEIGTHLEKAEDLTGGKFTVLPSYNRGSYSPFDTAVRMRGMQDILMDVMLSPEKVKELMEFITSAQEEYEPVRKKNGLINVFSSQDNLQQYGFRVHCAYLSDDFSKRKPDQRDEWTYISAQTSAGLGPDQYAEFVYPYNARLAEFYTEQTVYYHGCECLDRKMEILRDLPNLRRFHVSPWSSVAKAAETFKGSAVLEVHDHPGKTFFLTDKKEMKKPIRDLVDRADGHPMDLNISDIHSFNDDPGLLTQWAECAQECAVE